MVFFKSKKEKEEPQMTVIPVSVDVNAVRTALIRSVVHQGHAWTRDYAETLLDIMEDPETILGGTIKQLREEYDELSDGEVDPA